MAALATIAELAAKDLRVRHQTAREMADAWAAVVDPVVEARVEAEAAQWVGRVVTVGFLAAEMALE